MAIKNLWAPSDFEDLDADEKSKSTAGKGPQTQNTAAAAVPFENPSGTFFMAGSYENGQPGLRPSAKSRVLAAMCGGALWVSSNKKRQMYNMYRDMRVVSKIR